MRECPMIQEHGRSGRRESAMILVWVKIYWSELHQASSSGCECSSSHCRTQFGRYSPNWLVESLTA
eukprot:COSAG03_NODE_2021_length_3208_cov_2.392087_5_plen_66_part_00